MKIIFLDIDGVLATVQSSYWYREMLGGKEDSWVDFRGDDSGEFRAYEKELCPISCSNLKVILEMYPETRIVISSTWRKGRDVAFFNRLFKFFKITKEDLVIDKTPVLHTKRGVEIQKWLDDNSDLDIDNVVIIDDDSDMEHFLDTPNFVKVRTYTGFDWYSLEKVDKLFGNYTLKFEELVEGNFYKMYSKPKSQNYFKDGEGMSYYDKEGILHKHVYLPKDDVFAEV